MISLKEKSKGVKPGAIINGREVLGWQFKVGSSWKVVARCQSCGFLSVVNAESMSRRGCPKCKAPRQCGVIRRIRESAVRVEHGPWRCIEWRPRGKSRKNGKRPIIRLNGSDNYVYRVVYELFVEPIKEGNIICHHCDNGACINPSHLFQGTQRDNVHDMITKGRQRSPSKLTEQDVVEIREAVATTEANLKEVAEQYEVSLTSVCNIVTGKTMKDCGGPITRRLQRIRQRSKEREEAAAELRCQGLSQREIGRRLNLSQQTVGELLQRHAESTA